MGTAGVDLPEGESEEGRRGSFAARDGGLSISEGKTGERGTDFDGFDPAFGRGKVVDRRDRDGVVLWERL
jgi:hypothetical protein